MSDKMNRRAEPPRSADGRCPMCGGSRSVPAFDVMDKDSKYRRCEDCALLYVRDFMRPMGAGSVVRGNPPRFVAGDVEAQRQYILSIRDYPQSFLRWMASDLQRPAQTEQQLYTAVALRYQGWKNRELKAGRAVRENPAGVDPRRAIRAGVWYRVVNEESAERQEYADEGWEYAYRPLSFRRVAELVSEWGPFDAEQPQVSSRGLVFYGVQAQRNAAGDETNYDVIVHTDKVTARRLAEWYHRESKRIRKGAAPVQIRGRY